MKQLLTVLIVLSSTITQATNYYVSSTGNDANNGLTQATAWQSIKQVNSFNFAATDHILFKRGEIFNGAIQVKRSSLFFEAYGTGPNPIITGLSTVTGWTNIGGNIWESAVITTTNVPNIITINGESKPMGRYPDNAYLPITGATANSQIVSTSLTGSPDWTGAEVCIRKNHWIISRDVITSHTSSTINYTGTSSYNSEVGYGFFVQNSLAACTSQDEWFFNNATDKLYIYSASVPINVKISTINKGIDVGGFDYINIVNLAIEGMNVFGINIGTALSNSIGCTIDSCSITNSGRDAIHGTNNNNLTIKNCTINNSFNNGIYMENEGGTTISLTVTNCKVTNTGKYPGMGYPNNTGGTGVTQVGIHNLGEKGLIQNNTIDTTGFVPIWFKNDSTVVRNNNVNYFCFVKDDGAGIYTHTGYDGVVHFKGRRIISNIVRNGIGAGLGTRDLKNSVHGIYLDDGSSGVVIDSNTIINTAYGGLYVHNADSVIITNNTIYGCNKMQLLMVHDMASPVSPLRKITMKNNLFFSTTPNAIAGHITSICNDIDSMSFPPYKIDSNIYCNPTDTAEGFFVQRYGGYWQTGGLFKERGNLSLWKDYHSIYDANSISPAISFPTYTINSYVGGDKVTNGICAANITNFAFFAPTSNTVVSWDGTSKITGTGSYKQVFTTPDRYTRTMLMGSGSNSFAIDNAKQYIVKFKIKSDGSAAGAGSFRVYFRMFGSPFNTVSNFYYATYNATIGSYEVLIKSPTTTASATFVIEASEDGGVIYTDDISVFEVTTTDVDNSSNMSIEYNASNTPRTVTFSGLGKKDVYGNVYNNSVTIPAWGSKVLIANGIAANSNKSPLANAGTDKIFTLPTNSASLTGTGTDNDGTISSYTWVKIAGPAAGTIVTANAATTTVNNLVQGVYQYELTVTDNNRATGKDTVRVTVNAAVNIAPAANAGADIAITLPANSANLTGTGTDTDGTISSYSWVKIAGPAAGTIATANAATTTVANLVQGVYQFQLTVTDNNGAIGKDTVQVIVNKAVNLAPIANAGLNNAITLPINSTSLTGTGTDTDGTISSYAWVKIAGPAAGTIINPATATTTLTSLVQGVYQFQLIVTDNYGAIGKDTVQVTVNEAVNINQIPVANAGADINIVLPSNTVQLTGTGIDSDGVIISYNWSVISGPAGFIFSSPLLSNTRIDSLFQGVYDVELTVKDNLGAIAKDTVTITVSAPRLSNISSNEFKVYPNPVRDIATLEINTLNTHTNLSVSIFDESGKLVLYNEFVTATSYTQRKLNMTSFSNGFYILNVRFDDGKMFSKRIFKYGER